VDDLWATKSEGVGLIVRAIKFPRFPTCARDTPTLQTDGQTTCMQSQHHAYRALHGKNQLAISVVTNLYYRYVMLCYTDDRHCCCHLEGQQELA